MKELKPCPICDGKSEYCKAPVYLGFIECVVCRFIAEEDGWNALPRAADFAAGPWEYDRSKWEQFRDGEWHLVLTVYSPTLWAPGRWRNNVWQSDVQTVFADTELVAIARVNTEVKP